MELFDASSIYGGFEYPAGLLKVIDLGIEDMDYWFLLEAPFAEEYCHDMKARYPNRCLIPFAKKCDSDDVACFEIGREGKVEIIHDFADPGWEQRAEYNDFWEWFEDAIKELIERSRIDEQELQ